MHSALNIITVFDIFSLCKRSRDAARLLLAAPKAPEHPPNSIHIIFLQEMCAFK